MERDKRVECLTCIHADIMAGNYYIRCKKPDEEMEGSPYGIMKGLFDYPERFDSLWKEKLCKNYEHYKWTVEKLVALSPGVFAEGTGDIPEFSLSGETRWIAIRGQFPDWAIYFSSMDKNRGYIKEYGDKAVIERVIRKLVPCTDEAWGMYRR